MPERKHYPKATEELKPGSWKRFKVPGGYALLFMDTAGHIGSLDDHQIAEDGRVDPSVWCGEKDCTFHEWIHLDNYSPIV